jgi:hypothetical protein
VWATDVVAASAPGFFSFEINYLPTIQSVTRMVYLLLKFFPALGVQERINWKNPF